MSSAVGDDGSDGDVDGDAPLHLVFFPFLSRSHLTPILSFARLAAARGAVATVATTPSFAALLPATVRPLLLPFPSAAAFGLPDGCEDLSSLPRRLYPAFLSAVHSLRLPLRSLLPRLRPRPSALVSDALHHWAPSLALDLALPHVLFHTFGLFPASAIAVLHQHKPYSGLPRNEQFAITGFPHPVTVTRATLPEVFDHDESLLPVYRAAERRSWGVALNTFRALEPACAELYGRHVANAFLVGPACLAARENEGGGGDPVVTWLDGIGGEGEVVYVCFGSAAAGRVPREQLREIALGMEACGRPYVWAVRTDEEEDTWMPQGYEERVRDRAMVVRRWVPQQEILAHRAVGGFVCHCGWNSITEAVCAGVPMATWPLHSEQFLNEKMVVEVLRIGVKVTADDTTKSVRDEERAVVPAEAVARAVEQLMGGGEEANAMRRRVKQLSWLGQSAVAEGGSSYNDLSRMLDGLKALQQGQQLRDTAMPPST